MSQQPFITTVIPTYRRAKLLRRAIQSVLNQTYPHFRACVYDNASEDETEAVVAEIMRRDPRVYYHRHAENIGLERNFAYGAAQVATPFLNFLSDDDLLLPKFFETAMAAFEKYSGAAMFLGGLITVTHKGAVEASLTAPWEEKFYEPPHGFFQWLDAPVGWSSSIFKRTALDSIGGLDPSVGEAFDLDLMIRLTCRYFVTVSADPCALFFRGGASSRTLLSNWCHAHIVMRDIIKANPALDPVVRQNMASALDQFIAKNAFSCGLSASARLGRLDDARTAADLLRRFSPVKAQLAALFGSDSVAGRVARAAFRVARAARSSAIKLARYRNCQRLSAVVQEALAATSDAERTGA